MPRTTTTADGSAAVAAPSPATGAAKTARPKKPATTKAVTTATATKQAAGAGARKAPSGAMAPGRTLAKATGGYSEDTKFLERQHALLLQERATYVEQAKALRAEAESLVEEMEPGDIQFDEESGEGGTVTVDRERDLALSAQALAAVEEIDDALQKIERGTYGVCESCGELIPAARLEALPYARLCIACKSGGLSRR
ncbi:MAG: DnaK suppressor protein [Acidimicrobiaceae bacterium]|nr:DnaK suppressor protein [Acidimicrobiaceae bacterium]